MANKFYAWTILTLGLSFAATSWGSTMPITLFTFEKDFNSQNIMAVQAQVDNDCRFVEFRHSDRVHFLDFHWMMNRATLKEANSLLKQKIFDKLKFVSKSSDGRTMIIAFLDMNRLNHDLPTNEFVVEAEHFAGSCRATVHVALGRGNQGQTLELHSIYSKVKTNFLRIPTGIESVDLRGRSMETGKFIGTHFEMRR